MSLDVLFRLYRAGRIAAPLAQAMRLRWYEGTESTDCRLAWADAARNEWNATYWPRPTSPGGWLRLPYHDDARWDRYMADRQWTLALGDAATTGVLLAMLREATGDQTLHVAPCRVHGEMRWTVEVWDLTRSGPEGATEGEAIASALAALAAEVAP